MTRAQGYVIALLALVASNKLHFVDSFGFWVLLGVLMLDLWIESPRKDRR